MPKRPPRKGIAPANGSFLGFRDKVGQIFRAGTDVFVQAVHGQWGEHVPPGAVPVRLYKLFGWGGDKLAAYRLDAMYCWCLNYPMLVALGQYVSQKIPDDVLALMAADHRKVVETNWACSDDFETLLEDVEMRGFFSPTPPPGAHVFQHVGTLTLALTEKGNLRKHGGCNYATAFRRWRAATEDSEADSLSCAAPTTRPSTVQGLAVDVASGGGPDLTNGERIEVGADELVVRAVEYDTDYDADDALAAFSTGFAYITNNAYDDPLEGIELLDHARLRVLATDATTLKLLDDPDRGKRHYLGGAKELLPGWREVSFPRDAIRRSVVSVNPTMTEGVALLRGDADTFSFECAVRAGGALVPLRRCGDTIARGRLPSILLPSARAMRGMAQTLL
eukprot:2155542-Prymnesium_polylepis.1